MHFLMVFLLLISVSLGIHVVTTSPQPPPQKKHRSKLDDMTPLKGICFVIGKYTLWAHVFIEIALITTSTLAEQFPASSFATRANNVLLHTLFLGASPTGRIAFPPARILGGLLMIVGSGIRYLCYRELGRHFTFHVALLPEHALITSGPYGVVRHPAYVGGYVWHLGSVLWHGSAGAWLRESRAYTLWGAWFALAPVAFMVISMLVMGATRIKKEDDMSRKEFGKSWERWVERVPHRVVPGVY
ncbi:hypothetical protein HYPSUDRAFT_52400 [Hypholoma sublateritium FD-334 SS-4]|uniref:Uncharacterized protein n=1 Tax=Hypholoma sublateritium (strain FD-334 SS-4) TaxID=945553 RepID=A0A0D2MR61_HYPSF|nr:hypothetical protein HYPSUDRAFT_52400 [Hypholoma sublateritium FD-334 SS-4]